MSSAPNTQSGLGRGLEVLIGGRAGGRSSPQLPVDADPRRTRASPGGASSPRRPGLAESIRAQGLLQPVVVRPRAEGGYELIAGERRWRAAKEAGLPTVPAVVRRPTTATRCCSPSSRTSRASSCPPVEEARAYAVLLDEFGLSLGDVAERVGRSKSSVSNRVRLLELPGRRALGCSSAASSPRATPARCSPSRISEGRKKLAKRIVAQGLSVRAAERAARWTPARSEAAEEAPRSTRPSPAGSRAPSSG